MARVLRNTNQSVADLATAVNDLKSYVMAQLRLAQADVATIAADTDVGVTPTFVALGSHNDRTERTVTAAAATDLATSLVLVNQIRAIYEFHRVDLHAHAVADATNVIAAAVATSLATAITLANELKSDYNAHRSQSTVHVTNDSGNAIAATNASDQSSLNTLLNELKADLNLHMLSGPIAKSIRIVAA